MKLEELEFEVSKLSPRTGDILILRSDKPFAPDNSTVLAKRLRDLLPDGVQGVLIGPGFDLMLEANPVHEYECKCLVSGKPEEHGTCVVCGRSADEHRD